MNCSTCDSEIPATARFCIRCGKPVLTPSAPNAAEPRTPPPARRARLGTISALVILAIFACGFLAMARFIYRESIHPRDDAPDSRAAAERLLSQWNAWKSFGPGASVTLESSSKERTLSSVTTLLRRDAQTLVLRSVTSWDLVPLAPQEYEVSRPDGSPPKREPCEKCHRPHRKRTERRESLETIPYKGRNFECDVVNQSNFDCQGELEEETTYWLHSEVPGRILKKVSLRRGGGSTTVVCVEFNR